MAKVNYGLMEGRSIFVSQDLSVDLLSGQTVLLDSDNLSPEIERAISQGILVATKSKTKTNAADAEAKKLADAEAKKLADAEAKKLADAEAKKLADATK
jgi:hypothetical protein